MADTRLVSHIYPQCIVLRDDQYPAYRGSAEARFDLFVDGRNHVVYGSDGVQQIHGPQQTEALVKLLRRPNTAQTLYELVSRDGRGSSSIEAAAKLVSRAWSKVRTVAPAAAGCLLTQGADRADPGEGPRRSFSPERWAGAGAFRWGVVWDVELDGKKPFPVGKARVAPSFIHVDLLGVEAVSAERITLRVEVVNQSEDAESIRSPELQVGHVTWLPIDYKRLKGLQVRGALGRRLRMVNPDDHLDLGALRVQARGALSGLLSFRPEQPIDAQPPPHAFMRVRLVDGTELRIPVNLTS